MTMATLEEAKEAIRMFDGSVNYLYSFSFSFHFLLA